MATTKISTGVLKDGSVTSAKLDTNISIVGDLTVDTNTLFVDSASNNVGIGTSSPSAKFSVLQPTANTEYASMGSGGTVDRHLKFSGFVANGTNNVGHRLSARNAIALNVSDNDALYIDRDGNVGIGTSSPDYPIDIKSSTDIARFESTTNGIYNEYKTTSGTIAYVGSGSQTVSGAGITDFGIQASLGSFIVATGGNSERMRIDSSGNVGIGTTPNSWISVYRSLQIGVGASISGRTDDNLLELNSNSYRSTSGAWKYITSNSAARQDLSNGEIRWYNAPSGTAGNDVTFSERMRIDSSGTVQTNVTKPLGSATANLRLKTTVTGTNYSSGAYVNIVFGDENITNSYLGDIQVVQGDPSASTSTSMRFLTNSGGGNASTQERMRLEADGDLHVDGDVIAYSTTISDQRLKDDVQTIDNALDKVSNLRGVSYTWNNGKRKGQKDLGLIAQEVEQVLPELVREKEMPMIDGGTYKTVDYEKIVGVLIEAVKELKNEIESLKSK